MKVGYLIIGRLKSTRLKEKLLKTVEGRPILAHMIDRIKLAHRVDQIILCTSTNPQDDRLESLAYSEDIECFRGDEDDVLKRLHDAAVAYSLDYILNITADCPFVDPIYADRIVDAFERTGADLIRALDLPHGAFSYGIKPTALQQAIEIKADNNTEVWGRYFTDTGLFKVYDLPIENPFHHRPGLRMTLDYPEDLEFFKAVFAALYQPGRVFSLDEILHFLDEHPQVVEINRRCESAYLKRWTRQSEIALKSTHTIQRAAIIGCGSIGQRHARNLQALGVKEIVALRSRQGQSQELDPVLGIREVADWEELISTRPDVAIISNPTSLHLETATHLLDHVRGLFIEKPLSSCLDGLPEFLEQVWQNRIVTFVGYNLQFHPVVSTIENLLAGERLGSPILYQGQVGHWLPDWHPYEDYRQAYTARSDLGGGVSLTLIHEVHLAQSLLGPARQVACFLPRSEILSLPVDVIADLMIESTSGAISQIHLDFIQRPLHREGVISCERGWIRYDLSKPQVTVLYEDSPAPEVAWESQDYDANQPYIEEIRTFIRFTSEGRVRHRSDAWSATRSLATVMAAFESTRSGCIACVPDWVMKL